MLDQDINCVTVSLRFLVDFECFLVKTRVDGNVGNFRSIVIVEFLDVVPNTSRISLDRSENQEILQVLILAEG